jgi:hypothetical protein
MTEGNTELVLHDESLDHVVAVLRGEEPLDQGGKSETIANTIDSQR